MPHILLTNHYEGIPYQILKDALPNDFDLTILNTLTKEELVNKAPEADYFLVSGRLKIDKDVLNSAVNLKMIQRTGVGLDVFDMEALKNKGVPLYVNQGINSQSVAEHTVLLILAALKRLTIINNNVKNGIWKKQEQGLTTYELAGKTVGLIGIGNIGQKVAKMLAAFGADILYYDKFKLDSSIENEIGIKYVSLNELFSGADIVSLHCPLTDETSNIINSKSLALMKDGAILINTSRGQLVCEQDLINALNTGKIRFAGLDVYEQEPVKNKELLSLENVITTPHIGGVSYDSFSRMMSSALKNISLFENGKYEEIEKYKYLF